MFCFCSHLLSAFLGGIVSFLIWVSTNRCSFFLPQIGISSKIVKRQNSPYEIKIINLSHTREVHDVAIYAMYKYASGNHYESKLGHIALLKETPKDRDCYQKDEFSPFELKLWVDPPKRAETQSQITLKEFFQEKTGNGTKGYLDVVVVCYDSLFSSARQVKTMRYTLDSIVNNAYFEPGSIIPKELPDNNGILIHNDHYN